jgi:hypothetical protein
MGEFSIFHWLIVFMGLAAAIPIARILSRTGHNAGWCVFVFFPLINLIMLLVFAFKPRPIDKKPPTQMSPQA